MKKKNFYHIVLAFAIVMIASSCTKDDSVNNTTANNTAEIQQVNNEATSGSWRITSYIDSGQDETHHFTGYSFTFNTDGTLTATNGTNTYTGVWSVTDSDSSSNDDDGSSSSSDIDFNIMFSAPPKFTDLTDDWDIVSHTSSKIDLIDVSGGNGGTDTLTFEKN